MGHNETDPRKKFVSMPLDLGDHPGSPVPTEVLIFEIGKPHDGLRPSPDYAQVFVAWRNALRPALPPLCDEEV